MEREQWERLSVAERCYAVFGQCPEEVIRLVAESKVLQILLESKMNNLHRAMEQCSRVG